MGSSMTKEITRPKLAICNFKPNVDELVRLALSNGVSGMDWTFKVEDLPTSSLDEIRLQRKISRLEPLEVRYHCAFNGIDLGDAKVERANAAVEILRRACQLVSSLQGRFMTIHIGLGRSSMGGLLWERSVDALADLVSYAENLGVCLCLENLAWGWSSRPELFEKLIRKSNAGITLDIGHAQVSPSVECQHYQVEDFVAPHPERVFNAHIYHEERDDRHLPPTTLSDVLDRLNLLSSLPCDWWVLELREDQALQSALRVVHEYLDNSPAVDRAEFFALNGIDPCLISR